MNTNNNIELISNFHPYNLGLLDLLQYVDCKEDIDYILIYMAYKPKNIFQNNTDFKFSKNIELKVDFEYPKNHVINYSNFYTLGSFDCFSNTEFDIIDKVAPKKIRDKVYKFKSKLNQIFNKQVEIEVDTTVWDFT